jgi:hypothetical protein
MTAKKSAAAMSLAEARKIVAAADDKTKAEYDKGVKAAQDQHQAELDFIKSCTPEQVAMAGLTIGPMTTHAVVYARLKAVVGNG